MIVCPVCKTSNKLYDCEEFGLPLFHRYMCLNCRNTFKDIKYETKTIYNRKNRKS